MIPFAPLPNSPQKLFPDDQTSIKHQIGNFCHIARRQSEDRFHERFVVTQHRDEVLLESVERREGDVS